MARRATSERPASRLLDRLPNRRPITAAAFLAAALSAALIIAQATLLATILAAAFDGETPGMPLLVGVVVVVLARAALHMASDAVAQRAAATIKTRLRAAVLADARRAGPGWRSQQRRGEIVTLLTRGIDALDPYLTGYLPALAPAVIVPVAVVIWLAATDWVSAIVIAATVPLVPVFGALVGLYTKAMTLRQWHTMQSLGGHFADMVAGLPTLRMFGRAQANARAVGAIAHDYRHATMRTLRIAFLSALVLELVAAISVALVAVPIGLRLVAGDFTLQPALVVLLLAPEAYMPLRALGTRFHAAAEGVTVAEEIFGILDRPRPQWSAPRSTGATTALIELDGVGITYPGRNEPALRDVSLRIEHGERIAITGPSGAGKTTLLAILLGLTPISAGRLILGGADAGTMTDEDWARWRSRIGWIGQHPHLFADTLAANIALGGGSGDVRPAARAALVDRFAVELPRGYSTRLGERGLGLSAGQRQRVALARAYYRAPAILLLDEPTAHLDPASEALVLQSTQNLIRDRTALFVSHRPSMLALAGRLIEIRDGRLVALERQLAGVRA